MSQQMFDLNGVAHRVLRTQRLRHRGVELQEVIVEDPQLPQGRKLVWFSPAEMIKPLVEGGMPGICVAAYVLGGEKEARAKVEALFDSLHEARS